MTPAELAEYRAFLAVMRTRPSAKRDRLTAKWKEALLGLPPDHPRRLQNPNVTEAKNND